MEKINFENLPSENTPINQDNLNLMQSNIEKSVVAVGKTQPSTSENVWIKKGKNLFDNTFIQMRNDAPSTTRIEGKKIPLENVFDTPQAVSLSNNLNLSTYKWSVNIKTNTGGNYDYDTGWLEDTNSWTVSQSRISEFMSRGNAQIYFVIAKKDGTNIYVSEMNNYNFQIEVGTTATTYEPYVEKEILVKNSNNVFEKFYNENDSSIISFTNENGTVFKFSDGTMVCYGTKTFTKDVNSLYEDEYFASTGEISFPQQFISVPTINITAQNNNSLLKINIANCNTNEFSCYISKAKPKTNMLIGVHFIAIGRWK